eukprot:1264086-Amphidinium_carterae.1
MLSGRSTVLAAWNNRRVEYVLAECSKRLGLADDGTTMELWHGSGEVLPARALVQDLPGIQPKGEISEYQLVMVMR